MADKNIQIRYRNKEGGYDNLFPITKQSLVEGLDNSLNRKADKTDITAILRVRR